MAAAKLSVLVGKNFACVKIAGRANFACSPDFKALLDGLAEKQFRHFIMDLTECPLMDSTFLGVLAGFGMKLNPKGASAEAGIELHNASERVTDLLESLGAVQLFRLTQGELKLPEDVKTCTPESINPSHEQIARTSLEAHETLMAMNPDNVARFKDVTQFLAEDLRNIEKSS